MATITTTPAYPPPKKPIYVTFTAAHSGNFVRVYCTAAPPGSDLDAKLTESPDSRVPLHAEGIAGHWRFTPDVGGVYVLSIEEITHGATTHGGGWHRSPDADTTETILSTDTVYLYVGERLTWRLGVSPDTATLVLWIWNGTIRATTTAVHGEVSPAIVKPSTQAARTAMIDSALTTAVDALADATASTALGSAATVVSDLQSKMSAHMGSGTFHATADTYNAPADAYATSLVTRSSGRDAISGLAKALYQHGRNDDGNGFAARHFHAAGGATDSIDWGHRIPVQSSGGGVEDWATVAALWRAYEAHRVSSIHTTSDTTNAATALPALGNLHKLWLDVTDPVAPTAPATMNAGAVSLVHGGGFVREPL